MNNHESPHTIRENSAREISFLKDKIADVEKKQEMYQNRGYARNHVIFDSLRIELENLRRDLHSYYDTYKQDPNVITPNLQQQRDELKYIQEKIVWTNEKLAELQEEARREFFRDGAIKDDGTKNEEYYRTRQTIDYIQKEKEEFLPYEENIQREKLEKTFHETKKLYRSNEFLGLDAKLESFMEVELAPGWMQDSLDRARAFLAFCKERSELINMEPIVKAYSEVSSNLTEVRTKLDLISVAIAEQGIKVQEKDLQPYLDAIKKEREEKPKGLQYDIGNIRLLSYGDKDERAKKLLGANMDSYEQDKFGSSAQEAELLSNTMKRYMEKMKELDGQNIHVVGKEPFDYLRRETALFGPDSLVRSLTYKMLAILNKVAELEKESKKE